MRLTRALVAVACALGATVLAPGTGYAGVEDCTVTPGPGAASGGGSATCPAGAGDFRFRVVVDCYDAYPAGLHFTYVGYGPWVYAGGTSPATSALTCHGYVPGSGVGFNGRIETAAAAAGSAAAASGVTGDGVVSAGCPTCAPPWGSTRR